MSLTRDNIRIETAIHVPGEGKSSQGCPIAKYVSGHSVKHVELCTLSFKRKKQNNIILLLHSYRLHRSQINTTAHHYPSMVNYVGFYLV